MPQNSKDSNGGKNKTVKDTADNTPLRAAQGSAGSKSGYPADTQHKGEKKTTP